MAYFSLETRDDLFLKAILTIADLYFLWITYLVLGSAMLNYISQICLPKP